MPKLPSLSEFPVQKPDLSGTTEALQNYLQGFKAQRAPYKEQQEEQMQRLKQALTQAQTQQQLAQAQQTQQKAQQPFGGQMPPGAVGQSVWLEQIRKQYGENSPIYQRAKKNFELEQQQKQSVIQRYNTLNTSQSIRNRPTNEKQYLYGKARGLGYTPEELEQYLSQGYHLNELAQLQGKNLNDVPMKSALSSDLRKQARRRQGLIEEIRNIEQKTSQAMAPYSRRVLNYSPKQMFQAIQNANPDQQAKLLAARAIQPELANLRNMAMGGRASIQAIQEIMNKSMADLNVFQGIVSPEVYQKSQDVLSDWIKEGTEAFTQYLEEQEKQPRPQQNNQTKSFQDMSDEELDEFIRQKRQQLRK